MESWRPAAAGHTGRSKLPMRLRWHQLQLYLLSQHRRVNEGTVCLRFRFSLFDTETKQSRLNCTHLDQAVLAASGDSRCPTPEADKEREDR